LYNKSNILPNYYVNLKKCSLWLVALLNFSWKKFRIGTSLAELAVVRASRMKIIHVVTVINTTFPVADKVIYTFIYYYLIENRPYI